MMSSKRVAVGVVALAVLAVGGPASAALGITPDALTAVVPSDGGARLRLTFPAASMVSPSAGPTDHSRRMSP